MDQAQSITLTRHLEPGLYRLDVDADGRWFAWERLYIVLNIYNNRDQRTGPWDFDLLNNNRPVLPAYWVYLNDHKIGLWYFNRPSQAQITGRRFRGEASFWIQRAGEYTFRFEPYRAFCLSWTRVELGPEVDDRLLDCVQLRPAADQGVRRLFHAGRWDLLRTRLGNSTLPYCGLLEEALQWARLQAPATPPTLSPAESADHKHTPERSFRSLPLPLLAAGFLLEADQSFLDRARFLIEHLLSQPAWGNPREDGYGHNGDMGAALTILDLALALNLLADTLAEPLQQRMLRRLERQGDTFLDMALLHRGYWGGSILQDHGFRSFSFFTSAAYALVGWTPRAEQWLRFCLPRMARTMEALPTDGVVPQSSYHLIALYTDKVVLFRELHRQATGEDVYERAAWQNVASAAYDSYLPEVGKFLHASPRGDLNRFYGGHPFLDQMARDFADPAAAWLAREYARAATSAGLYHGVQEQAVFAWTLWAALLWEPTDLPEPKRSEQTLRWYRDTGAVAYRHERTGLVFSARCGPPNGATAWRNTTCCCDRAVFAPMSGTFAVAKHGQPLIRTAEGGYKMRTELANVVLIDGQGQYADHGPPMSCPDHPYRGEKIVDAQLREGRGWARLALSPAYDPALAINEHTREFLFERDGRIRLADRLSSDRPHRFAWRFHFAASCTVTREDRSAFAIRAGAETLILHVNRASTAVRATVRDTLVVWAYCNENQDDAFRHIEFETLDDALSDVDIEFCLQ